MAKGFCFICFTSSPKTPKTTLLIMHAQANQ